MAYAKACPLSLGTQSSEVVFPATINWELAASLITQVTTSSPLSPPAVIGKRLALHVDDN
jgi:hypothetical protein